MNLYVVDVGNGRKEIRTGEALRSREEAKYAYADAMLKARKLGDYDEQEN